MSASIDACPHLKTCYLGNIPGHPEHFVLDDHHRFERGTPVPVCGNTADMLSKSWYRTYFGVRGDKHEHCGLFACAPAPTDAGRSACC